MNVGVMQPYFFPYIGYFQMMSEVDVWVIFDDIQFVNKGWVNRNRVLHPEPNKEWQYITLSIDRRDRFKKINQIKIKDESWKQSLFGKLSCYRKSAPYYFETIRFLDDSLEETEGNFLLEVLESTLKNTANFLSISPKFYRQSDFPDFSHRIEHPGQWALEISKYLGATRYLNPVSGASIFDKSEFEEAGIDLSFFKPRIDSYCQGRREFCSGLSIIDVLMWNGPQKVERMIKES